MKLVVALALLAVVVYNADAGCLSVRGRLMCPDRSQKHDGQLVVIKLIEGDRSELDEGYASKNGYFSVHGCSSSNSFEPQLHIISKCRGDSNSRIRYSLQRASGRQTAYNITDLINLKAYNQREETYNSQIRAPCY